MDHCLDVCNLLKAASSCCERELSASLAELDVSHCQATILIRVSDEATSMSSLSKFMCCHKSNITQVVAGLLKKGLIQRTSLKSDKRVSTLTLSAKGKVVVGKLKSLLSNRACDCMSVFTPAEKKTFADLLRKYVERHRA